LFPENCNTLSRTIERIVLLAGLILVLHQPAAEAQILKDTSTLNKIKKDIDYIYNMQFTEARELYGGIAASYPGHPVVYLLRGMITYWENYPLLSTSVAKTSFEADLKKCIELSNNHNGNENEAEYLLANMSGRGFLLLFYSDNDLTMEVIPLLSGTYKSLMRSFDFTSQCSDLYYFTGVYNFYRDEYPKAYPVYKPVAMWFPSGDVKKGLYQLNVAAVSSVVLRAEATFLLAYIYTNFENNYDEALIYSRSLHEQYPHNPEYLAVYLKNLFLLKQYDEAEKTISSTTSVQGNKFLQAQMNIFRGMLQEKKYLDLKNARVLYNKGISDLSVYGDFGNEYTAYGYFGLSRITEAEGEKHTGQMYRKEALRLADFKKIPVYVFVDGDPYGITNIYRTLKVGSGNAAHLNEFFCVPQARFLGITPQDIVDYKLPTHPLKDVDIKRARDAIKNDPFIRHYRDWVNAIEHLLQMGVRAEQQALAKHGLNYVIDTYLPQKLAHPERFLP